MTDLRTRLQESLGNSSAIERELGDGGMSHVLVAEARYFGFVPADA